MQYVKKGADKLVKNYTAGDLQVSQMSDKGGGLGPWVIFPANSQKKFAISGQKWSQTFQRIGSLGQKSSLKNESTEKKSQI